MKRKNHLRGLILALALLLVAAPIAWSGSGSSDDPDILNLGEEYQWNWYSSDPCYMMVYVESSRPLVVELDPINADFDLEVWGADDYDRDPYESSNNGGTETDWVVIDTSSDYWYMIKVTPYDAGGGSFYISTSLQ